MSQDTKHDEQTTVATPNTFNLMQRPPLSRKYILNPQGTRLDIPDWSIRSRDFVLKSIA